MKGKRMTAEELAAVVREIKVVFGCGELLSLIEGHIAALEAENKALREERDRERQRYMQTYEKMGLESARANKAEAQLAALTRPPSDEEVGKVATGLADMTEVVRRVQDALADYIVPDADIDAEECINTLLGIVDHRDTLAKQRAALAAIPTAICLSHQVSEAREKALEEAARVCDVHAVNAERRVGSHSPDTSSGQAARTAALDKMEAAQMCAYTIRALKSSGETKPSELAISPRITRVAKPNHLTYCDEDCTEERCSETHERREVVCAIDSDD